jgi:hypothetical protein
MPYYKFTRNDIFRNEIETHPQCDFLFHNGKTYFNREQPKVGVNDDLHPRYVTHVGNNPVGNEHGGYISLYELNVDRNESEHTYDAETDTGKATMIYPFITKDGSLMSFKTVSTSAFQSFSYGAIMSSSYPLSATIATEHYYESGAFGQLEDCPGDVRRRIVALKNTLNYYTYLSPSFSYDHYDTEELQLVSIPSIFFGSSIDKGSVSLKLYYTGSLVAELTDFKRDGELVQTYPEVSPYNPLQQHKDYGKVAGVVLYNEGFVVLTGDWDLHSETCSWLHCPDCDTVENNLDQPSPPRWIYFANEGDAGDPYGIGGPVLPDDCTPPGGGFGGGVGGTLCPDWAWSMTFEGTNYIPVLTMLTHAPKGELNHSNNPTFIQFGQNEVPEVSNDEFIEKSELTINNTVKTPYNNPNGHFQKQTWISKVGIYDKDKNLIGIAKLATPVKKTEEREFTFKLKLDF